MDKLRILLGLTVGGYWVYLVQTRKLDLKPWEYWAGLGAGAYWAWLTVTTPSATTKKVGARPSQTQAQLPAGPGPGTAPGNTSPPVSTEEHISYPGIVYPPPDEQEWMEEKGEEGQRRMPPVIDDLPNVGEWELPDR